MYKKKKEREDQPNLKTEKKGIKDKLDLDLKALTSLKRYQGLSYVTKRLTNL